MQAYELHQHPGTQALTRVERVSPPMGPRDVRIRVRAVSLNARDSYTLKMASNGELPRPLIPASDGAGEVIGIGAAVTRFNIGDRVMGWCSPNWIEGAMSENVFAQVLGGNTDGMLAEEVVLHEEAVVALPEYLSFEEGATLPCAGVTAWNALFETGCAQPGNTVLLQGSGGVSVLALQFAKAAGLNVIMTSSSEEKRRRAEKMGADHTIDYVAMPNWAAEVQALTHGKGADLAIEVGGPGTFDQTASALRYEGHMIMVGALTGFVGKINVVALILKGLRVTGIYIGTRRTFESLTRALEVTRVHPVIDSVFEFDQAPAAYERLASGNHFGKVVIRVN